MFEPTSTHIIPVSPFTEGWENQRLALERHEFPSITTKQRKVTFLFSHANGFHKEAYRPLMQSLKTYLRGQREYDATEIQLIAWDARTQGDSARLNHDLFNPRYRCLDHALDTKQIVDTFKADDNDQWIGVGHSFGACAMLMLESLYPRTFDNLCIIEPVILSEFYPMEIVLQGPLFTSIKRRDEWSNRKECMESLSKRAFWKSLDPQVLENYVNYGMYDTDKGTVKLKCPKEHEHHTYICTNADSVVTYNCVKLLQIPTHFVFANQSFLQDEETVNSLPKYSSKISVAHGEGSHMMPCEFPDAMGMNYRYAGTLTPPFLFSSSYDQELDCWSFESIKIIKKIKRALFVFWAASFN